MVKVELFFLSLISRLLKSSQYKYCIVPLLHKTGIFTYETVTHTTESLLFIKSVLFIMAEPTLAQIFGTGATRLASGATAPSSGMFIPDSALTTAGLTMPTTASAEGHLVAVAINAKNYLSQTNFDANIDQSLIVADGFPSFAFRGTGNTQYRQDQITISLAKLDTGGTINPSSY